MATKRDSNYGKTSQQGRETLKPKAQWPSWANSAFILRPDVKQNCNAAKD